MIKTIKIDIMLPTQEPSNDETNIPNACKIESPIMIKQLKMANCFKIEGPNT